MVISSPMNPRKTFDEVELAELADNIEKQGLLQPITVRPVKHPSNEFNDRPDKYEIVCGERRFRACKILNDKFNGSSCESKFDFILAIVREMNDDEAFDAMITENLQRKDVDPMEEAFAFGKLIDKGNTAEEIATRFGKSIRFIQDRVKLNSLIPELMVAVKDGKMPIVAAQIICKLKEADQTAYFNKYKNYWEGFTKSNAQRFVDDLFCIIDHSLWYDSDNQADEDFAGACGVKCSECQFNTANHGCLFFEMKKDDNGKCTNPEKFNEKTFAYQLAVVEREAENLAKEGEEIKGKAVVGINLESYDDKTTQERKERLRKAIAERGFLVVNPNDSFGFRYFRQDDELEKKLASGEVVKVLSLFRYTGPKVDIEYYNAKKNDSSVKSVLPPKVSKALSDLKSENQTYDSSIYCECAKAFQAHSKLTNEPLSDVEKKAFCAIAIDCNSKLCDKLKIPFHAFRDDQYQKLEENPDIFNMAVRAYLQEIINVNYTSEMHQTEPLFDELGAQWCPEEYQKAKDRAKEKHDKKVAKLTKVLADEGYDADGNLIKKVEKLPKSSKPWEQFEEMKKKHNDAILLFRVGDFYETFNQDAVDVSEILGITLTKRANGDNGLDLCGFPHHALDSYLPKIIRSGKRVALCGDKK